MNAPSLRDDCIRALGLRQSRSRWRAFVTGVALAKSHLGREDTLVVLMKHSPSDHDRYLLAKLSNTLGIDLLVYVTGVIRALGTCRGDPAARQRPVFPGISSGHPMVTAGTLGVVAQDSDDELVLVSNNHVFAAENAAAVGDPILQPGRADGGRMEKDVVARLTAFVPLEQGRPNMGDMAVARPSNPEIVERAVRCLGIPQGRVDADVGTWVQKSGRTSGRTTGTVEATQATVWVSYGDHHLEFENQFLITSDRAFSRPGDSGSAVFDARMRACGLLFAGSDTVTVATPMRLVEKALGIHL